jgi:Carboxypeptidase regulatory-like domain
MTRRSKLAVLVVAGLVAMLLWWRMQAVKSVAPTDVALAASMRTEPAQAGPSAIESLPPAPERTPAAEIESARPATSLAAGLIRLVGSVLNPHGDPLTDPETAVALTSSSGDRRVTMIENGQYSLDGLQPGTYSLSFRKPKFKHQERSVVLRADEPVHREDLHIEDAWMITVHLLTPEGEDLRTTLRKNVKHFWPGPSVLATVDSPGDRFPESPILDRTRQFASVPADSSGLVNEGPYQIYVHADPPVFVSVVMRDQVLATQRVQDMVADLTFIVSVEQVRALLSGLIVRFVDGESGLPAVKAGVTLNTLQSTEGGYQLDEQGVLRIEDHLPGLYDLRAMLAGHPLITKRIELLPGRTVDMGTITLGTGLTVQGKCVDAEGQPRKVNLGLVQLGDDASSSSNASDLCYLLGVDDQGLFSDTDVPPARFELLIRPPMKGISEGGESGWAVSPLVVDTRNGSVENLVIVVHRPVSVALHPISTEVEGMKYAVITTDGITYHDGTFSGPAAVGLEFVPGDYTLRLTRASKLVRELPLTVGTQPMTIDVAP